MASAKFRASERNRDRWIAPTSAEEGANRSWERGPASPGRLSADVFRPVERMGIRQGNRRDGCYC